MYGYVFKNHRRFMRASCAPARALSPSPSWRKMDNYLKLWCVKTCISHFTKFHVFTDLTLTHEPHAYHTKYHTLITQIYNFV